MRFHSKFHTLTYSIAGWAFLALVLTGQLHLPAILIFILCLAFAVFRDPILWKNSQNAVCLALHKATSFKISRLLWTLVSLLMFLVAMYGWFYLGERMYSVTYFFLYLELNKLVTARSNRDYLQIFALTFFQMLAASVSTESFIFGPMLLVYLLLMLDVLTTFTIKRDVEAAFEQEKKIKAAQAQASGSFLLSPYRLEESDHSTLLSVMRLRGSGSRSFFFNLTLIAGVVVLGMGIFWVIPRSSDQHFINAGLLGGSQAKRSSGFADNVKFGGLGAIQNNPAIVMRAEPDNDEMQLHHPQFIRIRGTALDRFTGREWAKSSDIVQNTSSAFNEYAVRFNRNITDEEYLDRVYQVRLTLEPDNSGYFFTLDQPLGVRFGTPRSVSIDQDSQSIKSSSDRYDTISYTARGLLESPEVIRKLIEWEKSDEYRPQTEWEKSTFENIIGTASSIDLGSLWTIPRQLSRMQNNSDVSEYYWDERKRYLQLPTSLDQELIRQTAEEWIGENQTPTAAAYAIEQRFKREFNYSLENDFSNREDHIEYFLTDAQTGHCEYFATTMVVMLRSLGIPARIVNGYLSDEWSPTQSRFIIRQEHAHSWVEVMSRPDGDWLTFDPTPADGIGSNRIAISWYHRFSSMFDGVRMAWYESVVDYNVQDQRQGLISSLRFLRDVKTNSGEGFEGLKNLLSKGKLSELPRTSVYLIVAVILVAGVLIALIYFIVQHRKSLLKTEKKRRSKFRPDLKPFHQFLAELEKRFQRPSGQTLRDYANETVSSVSPQLQDFIPLTEAYYKARYNEDTWTPDDQQRLSRLVEAWENWKRENRG